VVVNNDNFLMQKKSYVFMPITERMEIIKSFGMVDKVVESIDMDLTVCKTLEWLAKEENLQIFANGGDRNSKDDISEAEVCEQNNIRLEFNIGGGKIQSSSSLVSNEVIKPWGSYKTFEKDKGFLVKRITVAPGEILSLQSHKHRSEHWLVASGVATVECDGEKNYLNQFEAKDYNKIKSRIQTDLEKQIKNSVLMKNAENRLISELQKLCVLTNSMGWTLQYNQQNLNSSEEFQDLKL
jgi:glycerol-3-phosphate cytidylyltransferase-like family protein